MIWALGKLRRTSATACDDAARVAVRGVDADDVAARRRAARRRARRDRRPTPTAAPTRRRPKLVLGRVRVLLRLLDVLDGDQALELAAAVDRPAASRCGSCAAAPWPPRATSPSAIGDELAWSSSRCTGWSRLRSKRMSRLVRMPTGRPSAATTGSPEISWRRISSTRRGQLLLGPDRDRVDDHAGLGLLDLGHLAAPGRRCSGSCGRCRCRPRAPCRSRCAASVTVSIADDTIGMASGMPGVSCVRTSTSLGMTSLSAGTSRTSSNVSASRR